MCKRLPVALLLKIRRRPEEQLIWSCEKPGQNTGEGAARAAVKFQDWRGHGRSLRLGILWQVRAPEGQKVTGEDAGDPIILEIQRSRDQEEQQLWSGAGLSQETSGRCYAPLKPRGTLKGLSLAQALEFIYTWLWFYYDLITTVTSFFPLEQSIWLISSTLWAHSWEIWTF